MERTRPLDLLEVHGKAPPDPKTAACPRAKGVEASPCSSDGFESNRRVPASDVEGVLKHGVSVSLSEALAIALQLLPELLRHDCLNGER